eukprot:scaffold9622_cov113-Isochrysis_galbana.AAC.3
MQRAGQTEAQVADGDGGHAGRDGQPYPNAVRHPSPQDGGEETAEDEDRRQQAGDVACRVCVVRPARIHG